MPRRASDLWAEHRAEVEDWIVREAGSIRPKAVVETYLAIGICYEAAGLPTHPQGEVLTSGEPRWSFARRHPAGVVSVIAPFNFPLILSIRSVAPALALGNAVLLKPDPRTAVCGGVALMRIFEEAGRLLKRAHFELSGNNALVVLPGADLAAAVSAGAFGSFTTRATSAGRDPRPVLPGFERGIGQPKEAADAACADPDRRRGRESSGVRCGGQISPSFPA